MLTSDNLFSYFFLFFFFFKDAFICVFGGAGVKLTLINGFSVETVSLFLCKANKNNIKENALRALLPDLSVFSITKARKRLTSDRIEQLLMERNRNLKVFMPFLSCSVT